MGTVAPQHSSDEGGKTSTGQTFAAAEEDPLRSVSAAQCARRGARRARPAPVEQLPNGRLTAVEPARRPAPNAAERYWIST
jgi:hypothetical protein